MNTERLATWIDFKRRLEQRYLTYPLQTRRRFLYRGHSCSDWPLKPSIDRVSLAPFGNDDDRLELLQKLVSEFKQCSYGLRVETALPQTELEWEYLARHHGLPTSILDWTQSPYVAAYFAFEGASSDTDVSIWVLQIDEEELDSVPAVQLDRFDDSIRFNLRSAEQFGVSMRLLSGQQPLETILANRLIRIDLPSSERSAALIDLDEMLINRRTLFRDWDGAARLAVLRLGCQ